MNVVTNVEEAKVEVNECKRSLNVREFEVQASRDKRQGFKPGTPLRWWRFAETVSPR